MRPEALPRSNPVIVDDAQGAKAHVRRVVIVREGEGVIAVEPAVIGMATFIGSSDIQFSRCRFHAHTIAAVNDSLQC